MTVKREKIENKKSLKNRNKIDLEENYRQLGMPKFRTTLNVR